MSRKKTVTYVIWKGDTQVSGVGVKLRAVEALTMFLEGVGGAEVKDGRHSVLVTMPDIAGDTQWLKENCIGEGSIVGSTSINDSRNRADKCIERYNERKGDTERVGWDILRYYLDHFYMTYDMWRDE